MIEFDYCINFLESFIICFFSYRYFSLNTKQLIVSNVIIFLEITLGNLFLSSSFLPVFFVLITMIFLLKNFGLKINIELIIANASIMLIDMISNITSLSLVTLLNMNFSFFNSSNSVLLVADYSHVNAPVVADLCTTPVALSAPPNSYQNNSQS